MGRTYEWGTNVFQDLLFTSLLNGGDISKEEYQGGIYSSFVSVIDHINENRLDSQYLDFEIRKKSGYFRVVAKNLISALWLSGIFPESPQKVIADNEFVLGDTRYKFKEKKRRLTYKKIKKKNG